ncbi:hypothetical protein V6N13_008060 [Hibiscus sabdariffa]
MQFLQCSSKVPKPWWMVLKPLGKGIETKQQRFPNLWGNFTFVRKGSETFGHTWFLESKSFDNMPPRRELRSGASDITNNQELGDELVRRDGMVPPPPPPVQVGGGTGGAQQVP